MKLTKWYSSRIKPVRVGWYERSYGINNYMDYWTGELWLWVPGIEADPTRKWRGLIAPSSKLGKDLPKSSKAAPKP